MMYTSERDYHSTKLIKRGERALDGSFSKFADWILEEFGWRPINIIYDKIDPNDRPKLSLIFELQGQASVFHNGSGYDEGKRKAVVDQFRSFRKENTGISDNSDIWVIFQEFEPAEQAACNEKIPQEEINTFRAKFMDKNLWEIARFGAYTTFFFETKEQMINSKVNGLQAEIRKEYLALLKPYDEFNYFNLENLPVVFDNKENFEENYQGNWDLFYK
ncbi:hypothetical protein [Pedobacter gandavensis]|uniref:Uncharacterized protein n=1 Tax=Pedobacter gandavensis TaxID=2679963 RepID=A0ABR6EVK6_9SPHI|nr:hypothetical protein [Pedobacter gandavensis]MBB2149242.1 hypothetical protein [Pedobacter gandavensis]